MNQSIEPPTAARWRALAGDRHAIANEMTDAEAKHLMRQIAHSYERLALHAAEREADRSPIKLMPTPNLGRLSTGDSDC
jgi:hypothetical protein